MTLIALNAARYTGAFIIKIKSASGHTWFCLQLKMPCHTISERKLTQLFLYLSMEKKKKKKIITMFKYRKLLKGKNRNRNRNDKILLD